MASKTKAVPEGSHTVTPSLVVRDASRAIEFYKRAFGAQEILRMPGPEGKGIMHAEIKIGDSTIYLSDEFPGMGCRSPESLGGSTSMLLLSVRFKPAASQLCRSRTCSGEIVTARSRTHSAMSGDWQRTKKT
jgi:uncharacterized glyoxalase superfamily protein PhnB